MSTTRTRSVEEVKARFLERRKNDGFGFEVGEYPAFMDWPTLKELNILKDGAKEEDMADLWQACTEESIKAVILDYLPFAWEKANNCRGISANRSIAHFVAWFWLLGDAAFADALFDDYEFYGKPQLVRISERVGFDWRAVDDGRWANDEEGEGLTAEQAMAKKV